MISLFSTNLVSVLTSSVNTDIAKYNIDYKLLYKTILNTVDINAIKRPHDINDYKQYITNYISYLFIS